MVGSPIISFLWSGDRGFQAAQWYAKVVGDRLESRLDIEAGESRHVYMAHLLSAVPGQERLGCTGGSATCRSVSRRIRSPQQNQGLGHPSMIAGPGAWHLDQVGGGRLLIVMLKS